MRGFRPYSVTWFPIAQCYNVTVEGNAISSSRRALTPKWLCFIRTESALGPQPTSRSPPPAQSSRPKWLCFCGIENFAPGPGRARSRRPIRPSVQKWLCFFTTESAPPPTTHRPHHACRSYIQNGFVFSVPNSRPVATDALVAPARPILKPKWLCFFTTANPHPQASRPTPFHPPQPQMALFFHDRIRPAADQHTGPTHPLNPPPPKWLCFFLPGIHPQPRELFALSYV